MRFTEFQPGRFASEGETFDHEKGQLVFRKGRWRWADGRRRAIPVDMKNRKAEDTTRFRRGLWSGLPETKG